ncbi:MAG: hypothetical protein KatS3mg060_1193 [Dehalococcoidia bacterium]|nr:MAG: hypothetical protein KatS3mg060_1193 [Dehalococcoidia bacterium]
MSEPAPVSVATVRAALQCERAGCPCARGRNVHCPNSAGHRHGDRLPSLTVDERPDGALLVHCKAGCDQRAVISALQSRGLWPKRADSHPRPSARDQAVVTPLERHVATYAYLSIDGSVRAEKARFERPDGSKRFRWRLAGQDWGEGLRDRTTGREWRVSEFRLYGWERVERAAADEIIWVVEGEKAADACIAQGLVAVSFGGGASSIDVGRAFDILAGREVRLWPDNDEPGRRYMSRVAAVVRPIARSVSIVTPPLALPPGGDAYDYFAAGGTVAALLSSAPPTSPTIEYLEHEALRVRIPTDLGIVTCTFSEIEKSPRSLDATLDLAIEGPGIAPDRFSQRLNLESSSQRIELRRELDRFFGEDYRWTNLLHHAIGLARQAFLSRDRAVRVPDIEPIVGPRPSTVDVLLPAGEPVVLFGDGSAGKTYLALAIALTVSCGLPFVGLATTRTNVLVIDYESTAQDIRQRCERLAAGLGLESLPTGVLYWDAGGVPIVDQRDALRRLIEREGVGLVIIDSAAAACGGKPEDAIVALDYFQRGLRYLGSGLTTLTIAHSPKTGDTEKPFGSAFWHNQPRRTWYVKRVQDDERDEIAIGLYPRKVNYGRRPRPIGLRLSFDGETGPVLIERTALSDSPELDAMRPLKDRIADILQRGALTVAEIAERLDHNPEVIAATLRKHRTTFLNLTQHTGRGHEARWGLLEQPATRKANEKANGSP